MATKLPSQQLAPIISSSFRPRIPIKPSHTFACRSLSSTAISREAQKPQDPKVVYSRPTTLGGADRKTSPLRIWPFVLILAGGFYAFNSLIKERSGTKPAEKTVKTEHPRG